MKVSHKLGFKLCNHEHQNIKISFMILMYNDLNVSISDIWSELGTLRLIQKHTEHRLQTHLHTFLNTFWGLFVCLIVCFLIQLSSPGLPGARCVDQYGRELSSVILPLLAEGWDDRHLPPHLEVFARLLNALCSFSSSFMTFVGKDFPYWEAHN